MSPASASWSTAAAASRDESMPSTMTPRIANSDPSTCFPYQCHSPTSTPSRVCRQRPELDAQIRDPGEDRCPVLAHLVDAPERAAGVRRLCVTHRDLLQ